MQRIDHVPRSLTSAGFKTKMTFKFRLSFCSRTVFLAWYWKAHIYKIWVSRVINSWARTLKLVIVLAHAVSGCGIDAGNCNSFSISSVTFSGSYVHISNLCGISDILFKREATYRSFSLSTCVNTVRQHFQWSILYLLFTGIFTAVGNALFRFGSNCFYSCHTGTEWFLIKVFFFSQDKCYIPRINGNMVRICW